MSLGEFYDHYNDPIRRDLWMSNKGNSLWKSVKTPILHLEVNINMTTVGLTSYLLSVLFNSWLTSS